MTTFDNRFNDFVNSHPRECLSVLVIGLGLVWQSPMVLLGLIIYVLYFRVVKSSRWLLFSMGLLVAIVTVIVQQKHQSIIEFIKIGFYLNGSFWKLILKGEILSALLFIFQHEMVYVLGFSIAFSGLLSLIDLISGNPHEEAMKALRKGLHSNGIKEVDDKALSKALSKLQDDEASGTVLGISKYSAKQVIIPDRDINQVALVLGTTGAGKTVTLSRFYRRAMTKGYPLIIVDGKPEDTNVEHVKKLAQQYDRPFFGFNCDENRHYDPLANGGFTELKDKIICLKDEWSSDYYRSIAEAYLQTTLQVLLMTKHSVELNQIVHCLTYKNLIALTNTTNDDKLMQRVEQLKNYEMKDITGLQAHLEILINSELGYFFEKNESSFSLTDVINQNGVVYFALPALRYPSFSKVLGKLVINDIKAVVERYKHEEQPVFTVFDEFSVFAGEQVLNLVNMGRGKGVHAIFGTQGLADLDRVDGNFKSQVLNCVNTIICHRLNDQESAEAVSNWIGTRNSFTVTAQLNMAQSDTGLGTVRRDREFIVHPDDIKQGLQTGEAFYVTKVGGFKGEKVRVKLS